MTTVTPCTFVYNTIGIYRYTTYTINLFNTVTHIGGALADAVNAQDSMPIVLRKDINYKQKYESVK